MMMRITIGGVVNRIGDRIIDRSAIPRFIPGIIPGINRPPANIKSRCINIPVPVPMRIIISYVISEIDMNCYPRFIIVGYVIRIVPGIVVVIIDVIFYLLNISSIVIVGFRYNQSGWPIFQFRNFRDRFIVVVVIILIIISGIIYLC